MILKESINRLVLAFAITFIIVDTSPHLKAHSGLIQSSLSTYHKNL